MQILCYGSLILPIYNTKIAYSIAFESSEEQSKLTTWIIHF